MLQKELSPEELEAWKRKRRGLDMSVHTVLDASASAQHPHGPSAIAHLLTSLHHHDAEPAESPDAKTPRPKLVPRPKLDLLHHHKNVA